MVLAVKCPECTAEAEFILPSSQAIACQLCECVFNRQGHKLGRSEPINRDATVFDVGVVGSYEGTKFTFVGCVQIRHELGGLWNEWVIVFDDLTVAILAEHQGLFALTYEREAASLPRLGDVYAFEVGKRYVTAWGELVVAERGRAIVAAVKGELQQPTPRNARWFFVDFSATDHRLATLTLDDPSDETPKDAIVEGRVRRFYIGPEVTIDELGLADRRPAPPETPGGALGTMPCPECNFQIEKRVGQYDVIVCPQCHTGMTVDGEGHTEVVFRQKKLDHIRPIELHRTATLDAGLFKNGRTSPGRVPWPIGQEVMSVGHVVRSVFVDGTNYYFEEILLSAGNAGFYWLVLTDATWYFARRISAAQVERSGSDVRFEGTTFTLQESNTATVEQVTGESYYQITVGERAAVADYKHGVRMISSEGTDEEVVWTECLRVDSADIARLFGTVMFSSGARTDDSGDGDYSGGVDGHEAKEKLLQFIVAAIFIAIVFGVVMCSDGGGSGCGGFISGGGGSFGK